MEIRNEFVPEEGHMKGVALSTRTSLATIRIAGSLGQDQPLKTTKTSAAAQTCREASQLHKQTMIQESPGSSSGLVTLLDLVNHWTVSISMLAGVDLGWPGTPINLI